MERSCSIPESEDIALERIAAYLADAGFKCENKFQYKRGSLLGSLTAFNPNGWEATARIRCSTKRHRLKVTVVLAINVAGQVVTRAEETYFNMELKGLMGAVRSGKVNANISRISGRLAGRKNEKSAGLGVLFSVIGAFLGGLLGVLVGGIFLGLGFCLGGMCFGMILGFRMGQRS